LNLHYYNAAWGELKRARRSGTLDDVARAARALAQEARKVLKQKEQEKEELAKNCSHPRVDLDGKCEVCGTTCQ
jgi:transposase